MGLRLFTVMEFSTFEYPALLYVHPTTKVTPKGMLRGEAFLVAYGTGVTWTGVGLNAAAQEEYVDGRASLSRGRRQQDGWVGLSPRQKPGTSLSLGTEGICAMFPSHSFAS